MGGGLMQLVAYGAQDIYLTGNPQITFFKVVYRRHTNFSMESIEQTWNGNVGFGNRVTATISRNGDLVHKMYIQYVPATVIGSASTGIGPKLGCGLLKEIEIEIGGQRIDKHYSHWLSAWEDLTQPNPAGVLPSPLKDNAYTAGGGNVYTSGTEVVKQQSPTLYQKMSGNLNGASEADAFNQCGAAEALMPLQFWFCRNPGLALPLIALQYHEVKVIWTLPTAAELAHTASGGDPSGARLYADYIYLDTDERRRFAQVSHEYLIEQLQYQKSGTGATTTQIDLNFNHPVKELIWGGARTGVSQNGAANTCFTRLKEVSGLNMIDTQENFNITLKLNGHDRFSARGQAYFSRQQVHDYHTGYGCLQKQDGLCVYSFALKPEEHQPSGTCNFSRIDNAEMKFSSAASSCGDGLHVYAVNYNVLRIMSGMGGLAYSN